MSFISPELRQRVVVATAKLEESKPFRFVMATLLTLVGVGLFIKGMLVLWIRR